MATAVRSFRAIFLRVLGIWIDCLLIAERRAIKFGSADTYNMAISNRCRAPGAMPGRGRNWNSGYQNRGARMYGGRTWRTRGASRTAQHKDSSCVGDTRESGYAQEDFGRHSAVVGATGELQSTWNFLTLRNAILIAASQYIYGSRRRWRLGSIKIRLRPQYLP